MKIFLTSLIVMLGSVLACDQNNCVINLQSESLKSIRLPSILSIGILSRNTSAKIEKLQKIFWSFKRIYYNLETKDDEVSQLELMISLDSEVQDNLKPKYSIYLNEDNKFDLIISNLSYSDTGIYKCNLWNQKTIYYRLIVQEPIKKPVLLPSYNEMIKEGDDLVMKCLSKNSYPYPRFTWTINGQVIRKKFETKLIDRETNMIESSIKFKSVNSSFHLNNITCFTTQSLNGTVHESSDSMVVNVGFKPILGLIVKNSNQTLNFSSHSKINLFENDLEKVKFKCNFKSNPSEVNLKWLINGKEIYDETNFEIQIKYQNLKKFNLTCQIENSVGRSNLRLEINILYQPKIKLEKLSYEIDEFTPFQLNCLFDSSPNVTRVEWLKVFTNQSNESQTVSETGLLDFKTIKMKENAGSYECRVSNEMINSFGIQKSSQTIYKIEILVRYIPIMSVNFKKQASNMTRKNLNISCVTMSYPEPRFTWFKNGLKLDQSSKFKFYSIKKSKDLFESILCLNDLNDGDFNQKYECESMNQLGSNRVEIELVPLSKPDTPSELRSLSVGFSTVTLNWSPGFDGGLEQTFLVQLNDSVLELNSTNVIITGPGLINLTQLSVNTIYSIRVMAKNTMGSSNWSDYILIRTKDITENDKVLLPVFESLFLNVPKNRLEFEFKKTTDVPVCFMVRGKMSEDFESKSCLDQDSKISNQLNLEDLELDSGVFEPRNVKALKVDVCFQSKPSVCAQRPMTAIIDTYNKISHLSLLKKSENFFDNFMLTKNLTQRTIPVALIVGVSACILTLVILLFVTIIFCIRKRNFKLCKSLLSQQNIGSKPFDEKIKNFLDHNKLTHSKSFNIDIHSISAPVASTVSISGSQLTNSTSSETSNLKQTSSTRRTFTAALTQTANNILHNSIGKGKISEILVTDEDLKLDSATSSTAVSNCSSQNLNTPYLYTDYTLFDQQGLKCESSTGSNSDPIAINNSLTSNSTSDSPIYGYNIAGATNAHSLSVQNTNLDSVFHVQQMNFHTSSQSSYQTDDSSIVRQQASNILGKQMKMNKNLVEQSTESGYSTPSRPKKVVYEVIV